jgi:hypothetical protein
MPRIEFDRRRFLVGALSIGAGVSVSSDARRPEVSRQIETMGVQTHLTPEVLLEHGFTFITPGTEPLVAHVERTAPKELWALAGAPYVAEAQGVTNPNPRERNRLLGEVGTLQVGLNEVRHARVAGELKFLHEVDFAVHGGSQLYINDPTAAIAVKTEGTHPLAYSLQPDTYDTGYYLTIYGGQEVAEKTHGAAIVSFEETPSPAPEAEDVFAHIAVLPGRNSSS